MNAEDLLRNTLHADAARVIPVDDLLDRTLARGRRRQRMHRAAWTGGSLAAVAAIAAAAVVGVNLGNGSGQAVTPLHGGHHNIGHHRASSRGGTHGPVTPWWRSWPTGRHDGPVDQTFDANLPASSTIYASGTAADGTDWAMYTNPDAPHVVQWMQGWDGVTDYGTSLQTVTPGLTWVSFSTPTRAAHDATDGSVQQWVVVAGRPGTTGIDYSPDGRSWSALTVHDGIAVVLIRNGFAPAAAKVRLTDAHGIYAIGAPDGAGAGQPSAGTGTATPSATPTSGS